MMPVWLHMLALLSLVIGFTCSFIIAFDVIHRPQHGAVMNVVWPLLGLFGGVLTLCGYYRFGILSSREAVQERGGRKPGLPFAVVVAEGTGHCGSGCALGDLCAEWLAFFAPGLAVFFGLGTLFGDKIFATWVLDYIFALGFGLAFQYAALTSMRSLSVGQGIAQAFKADVLSLTAWQIGMYGFMAFAHFYLFGRRLTAPLEVDTPEFWFMMQIAMCCGFITAYPVNWWLIRSGIKERM